MYKYFPEHFFFSNLYQSVQVTRHVHTRAKQLASTLWKVTFLDQNNNEFSRNLYFQNKL